MTKLLKGLGIVVVAFALFAGVAASTADALTQSEADAIIAALNLDSSTAAVINALVTGGSSSSSSCALASAPDLTIGSTGASVVDLQNMLVAEGYLVMPAGVSMGYFGSLTQSALASYQAAMGISPAVGYFGPVTRGSITCDSSMDDSDDSDDSSSSSDLGDDSGDITDVTETSSDDNDINEGETAQIIAAEAEIEGDVEINRVDFYLEVVDSTTASDNTDDYFQSATLFVDGEEIDSIDESDFTENSYTRVTNGATTDDEYRIRFSGLSLVFEDGDMPEFVLELEANKSIDSTDQTATWRARLDSIRYTDGAGFNTEDTTGVEEDFSIDSEETAELEVQSSSDDPDASAIEVDLDNSTDATVFFFDIEEKNGVDATIEDLTVTVTTGNTAGTATENTVVVEARLMNGSDELDSVSVPNGGVVQFEDIGLDIDADDTVNLSIELELDNLTGNYVEGTDVSVAFTSIDKAEDENGNDENDMTIDNGSVASEEHVLRTEGIFAEGVDTSYTAYAGLDTTIADNSGIFVFEIEITAFGEDTFIPNSVGLTSGSGFTYEVTGDSYTGTTTAFISEVSGDEGLTNSRYEVTEGNGNSAVFEVTVELDPATSGAYGVELTGVQFSATSTSATSTYTLPDVSEFEIGQKSIKS